MQVDPTPIRWMRRWAYDGVKPYREPNPKTGRMKLATKFIFQEVTTHKIFDDDVPLYAPEKGNG